MITIDYQAQCDNALDTSDWGSAAYYCRESAEQLLNKRSHLKNLKERYGVQFLGAVYLLDASLANSHFDQDTSITQHSVAERLLQEIVDKSPDAKQRDDAQRMIKDSSLQLPQL